MHIGDIVVTKTGCNCFNNFKTEKSTTFWKGSNWHPLLSYMDSEQRLFLPVSKTVEKKWCGFGISWGFALKKSEVIPLKTELPFGENVCLFEKLWTVTNMQFTYPPCYRSRGLVLRCSSAQQQTAHLSVVAAALRAWPGFDLVLEPASAGQSVH